MPLLPLRICPHRGHAFALLSLLLLLFFASPSSASEPELSQITVVGTVEASASGRTSLGSDVIEVLPRGNGSLNELLGFFPDVQLSEDARASRQGGEILPPPISISGGKTFQNHFNIDGIGNNSLLDPTADNPLDINNVPGHPQELFIDSRLIEEINLYDSNVPARFGGFTGGVVDVRTKSPGTLFGGAIDYRTTRSAWTSFHLDDADRASTSSSSSSRLQPEFEKQDAGLSLNIPINPDMGVLLSHRILDSKIPLKHLGQSKEEGRRLQNFFLKHAYYFGDDDLLETTLLYTPYRAERFIANSLNSDFSIRGGGLSVGSTLTRFTSAGEWTFRGSASRSENKRSAPSNWYQWANTGTHNWGNLNQSEISPEGGFGDLEKTQASVGLETQYRGYPISHGRSTHQFTLGAEIEQIKGTFNRPRTTYVYNGFNHDRRPIDCGNDNETCTDGEQYFTQRNVYEASAVETKIHHLAMHLEDEIIWQRLSLRPGVRLDADDFMNNLNLAPRLATHVDLSGTGQTILTAGLNRYYGRSLLTYKLREVILPFKRQSRTMFQNQLTDWMESAYKGGTIYRFSKLKTPYSDELALGLDQKLGGGLLSAKYVLRKGRNEFARELSETQPDGNRIYTTNNNGSSRHDSYRLAWERRWSTQSLLVNLTYQDSRESNEDYNDILEDDPAKDRVWFRDEVLDRAELPKGNYNRPWVASLIYSLQLGEHLHFTNSARYRSGYRNIEPTGETKVISIGETDQLTGESISEALNVYAEVKRAGALVFDWRLDWAPGPAGLLIELELLNVLNKKVETGTAGRFEMGRQLWAGASWSF